MHRRHCSNEDVGRKRFRCLMKTENVITMCSLFDAVDGLVMGNMSSSFKHVEYCCTCAEYMLFAHSHTHTCSKFVSAIG